MFTGTTWHEPVRVLWNAGLETRQLEEGNRTLLADSEDEKRKVILRFQKHTSEKNLSSYVLTIMSVLALIVNHRAETLDS